ncbi:MAG: hypothetical protein HWE24_07415 [Oceanospirillaceae bacterium]|nr:hypothetical protein [Oceanospirillaceae bacterium]
MTSSQTPEPKGQTKTKILSGLIEIYNSWKKQLDKLDESYYLRIWLFEPRFVNSQVVCAIGDDLDFYENTFYKPEESKKLRLENYGQLKNEMGNFIWEYRIDEDHFDNSELGNPDLYATLADYEKEKRRFEKMLKKHHRTTKLSAPVGEATELYSLKKGVVWIGVK